MGDRSLSEPEASRNVRFMRGMTVRAIMMTLRRGRRCEQAGADLELVRARDGIQRQIDAGRAGHRMSRGTPGNGSLRFVSSLRSSLNERGWAVGR
ncbi:hypothetical protein [Microbacterium neimengense]